MTTRRRWAADSGRVLAGLVGTIAVALAWQLPRVGLRRLGAPALLAALVGCGLAVLLSLAVAEALSRRLEGRSLLERWLRGKGGAPLALLAGVGAVCTLGVILGVELAVGWARIVGTEAESAGAARAGLSLLTGLVVFSGVGFSEELFFRGYLLDVLSRGRALWAATLVNGVLFGALHLLGGYPGAAATAFMLAGAVLFTGVVTALRELTGGLWAAMAWHALWDWAEDTVLGLGTTTQPEFGHSLLHLKQMGPALWVGREPMVECGLLYTISGLVVLAAVLWLGRKRIGWSGSPPDGPAPPPPADGNRRAEYSPR